MVLVICGNSPPCHHHGTASLDGWPDDQPIPLMGRKMRCEKCGHLGAETRPNWHEDKPPLNRYMPPGIK